MCVAIKANIKLGKVRSELRGLLLGDTKIFWSNLDESKQTKNRSELLHFVQARVFLCHKTVTNKKKRAGRAVAFHIITRPENVHYRLFSLARGVEL